MLRFRSVVVITSALHAEGPRFKPERNHYDHLMKCVKELGKCKGLRELVRFRSVVVITYASHA